MSELLVTNIYNQEGEGAPNFPKGATVTGVITATSFSGSGANLTGIDATALKDDGGSVKIQANSDGAVVTGILTVSSNVSIAGTLTYEDVTNIDSVGVITARSGIKVTGGDVQVGSATTIDNSGVNVTGVVTATSFEGSGANLTNLPPAGNTVDIVADGAIGAGKPCIVTSGGKAQQVGLVFSNPSSAPQNSTEDTGTDQSYFGLAWSPQRDRVILAQSKESGNKQASAKIGTPALAFSTNSLTFGSDQPFDTSDAEWTDCAYDPDTNQTIFVWEDMGSSSYGKCVLGTLTGGSYDQMTYGTVVTFESAAIDSCKVVYDTSNDKVVVIYRMAGTGYIKAIVGTVSGTNISFGTSSVLAGGSQGTDPGGFDACFAAGSINRVVVAFHNAGSGGGNYGNTVALQVSGTSITWGTPVLHNGNGATHHTRCCFDENAGKVVVSFRDDSNSGIGGVNVATISGNTVTFPGSVTPFPGSIQCGGQGLCYDPSSKDIFIFCAMSNSSNHGRIIRGTVSGNTFTSNAATTLTGNQDPMYSDNKNWGLIAINSGNSTGDGAVAKIVGVCRQQSHSNLKMYTFKTQTSATNINSGGNNVLGFPPSAINDGDTGTINLPGNTVDSQSGLTAGSRYYVQDDGTLSTTFQTSRAGVLALSATKGVVYGHDA